MNRRMHVSWVLGIGLLVALGAWGESRAAEVTAPDSEKMAPYGRVTFRSFCASCHGKEGKGDGTVAEVLTVAPTDLTRLAAENDGEFPADRVRAFIDGREEVAAHGRREMPIWGDAFQVAGVAEDEAEVEKKIAELVAYLQTIQVDE